MTKRSSDTGFEEHYLSLRMREGRLYSDEAVRHLPEINATHPLKEEWVIRKESCQRLIRYLSRKARPLQILEVGCGNGWLCHQLSKIPQNSITGIDINTTELAQAGRVFPSLRFLSCTLQELENKQAFDVIVFAASFQYFPSVKEVIQACFSHLKKGGEVHILDTHFYAAGEAAEAAERSRAYFASAGFPQMKKFYFHHTLASLEEFGFVMLYNPTKFFNRLFNKTPFPWLRLQT